METAENTPVWDEVWEIRRDGRSWVRCPLPNCGYEREALLSLKAAGYKLYCDGKMVKI